MKLLKSFILLAASISLIACGSDDDGNSTPAYEVSAENVVGTYTMTEYSEESSQIVTLNSNGNTVSEITISQTGDLFSEATIVLAADNTFTASGVYTYDVSVTTDGEEEEGDGDVVTLDDSGTYELDTEAEVITFNSTNGQISGDYSIESIDDDSAEFVQASEDTSVEDTTTTTTSSEVKFTFSR